MDSNLVGENRRAIATHIASLTGKEIAAALGIDPSGASRIKSGERGLTLEEYAVLFSTPSAVYPCGLSSGPADGVFVDREELLAIESLAHKYLEARARFRHAETTRAA